MSTAKIIEAELRKKTNQAKADFYPRFFKTEPGQYGEGDRFLGVVVPEQRKIARVHRDLDSLQIIRLLDSPWHECRLTGLFILVHQFQTAESDSEQTKIYNLYRKKFDRVNNWDLVDATAHKILGPYLQNRDRKPLYQWARARNMWKNRAAMVATYHYIRMNDFADTLAISESLLRHDHDLIHKAVGWMLRELGKRNEVILRKFLRKHGPAMPRTMLRYAIEKFDRSQRSRFLAGNFR